MDMSFRCVTIPGAAKMLGVSEATLRNYIKKGKFYTVRTRAQILIPLSEIAKYLEITFPQAHELTGERRVDMVDVWAKTQGACYADAYEA